MGLRAARAFWAYAAFIALACLSSHAGAQVAGQASQPAVRQAFNELGVDVISGQFGQSLSYVTIGPGDYHGLAYRTLNGTFSELAVIEQAGGLFIVTLNGRSDSFTGTFVSTEGNGATLVYAGGIYTYTSRDGTVARFASNTGYANAFYEGETARLGSITYPDGTSNTFTYKAQLYCPGGYDASTCNSPLYYVMRLSSVTNSSNYQLKIQYVNNAAKVDNENYADWGTVSTVTAINNAIEACSPSADTCTLTGSWPKATFSGGSATDPLGRPIKSYVTVTFDGTGKVATATRDGVTYTYAYVDAGTTRTTTVTDPNGGTRVYIGDTGTRRVASYRDELNRTTSYAYDTYGRTTQVTAPEGNAVQYSYDARGNVSQATAIAKAGSGLANIVTNASFDATCANPKTCNKPNWTRDAKANQTDYTYDANHGGPLTVTAPAGASGVRPQTRFSYTLLTTGSFSNYVLTGASECRTTASCAGTADEIKTTVTYASGSTGTVLNRLPLSISKGSGDNTLTATTAFTYDSIGNRLTIDGPLAGTADTTRIRYDAARQVIGTVGPDPDGAGALKYRAGRAAYNADSLPTLIERGTVNSQSDTDWAAFSSLQQVTSTWDANRHKLQDVATAGGTTYAVAQYSYDALGRPSCAVQRMNPNVFGSLPASACTASTAGQYARDNVTQTNYNAASQVTSVVEGLGNSLQRATQTLTYTPNGKAASVADGKGNLTTNVYDGFDRLSKTLFPTASNGSVSNTADYVQLSYDAASNVTQQRLRDGQLIAYSYDALNRVTLKDVPNTAYSEDDITYSYDLQGNATAVQATSGHYVNTAFDALGRAVTESSAFGSKTLQYDLAGRLTQMTWPDAFYVTYDHLVTGEVSAIRENGATSGIGVLGTYAYDDLGRLVTLTRGNGVVTSYGFNNASRLTSLTNNLAGTAQDVTTTFTYSPTNQIASKVRNNDAYAWTGDYNINRPYTANGLNQLTSAGSVALGYDGRGNLISSGTSSYSYTSENRLGIAGTTYMSYGPTGNMLQSTTGTNTTRFDYLGSQMVSELDTSNTITRRYVWGPGADDPLVWYEGSGTGDRRWLIPDERGSVIAVTGATGSAMAINSYDAYGIPAAANLGRFQYTGQAWLPDVGLYYYKARIYSPTLGRFMQTDPIGYGDGMNLYAYVGNDPINATDPSGLVRDENAYTTMRDGGTMYNGAGGSGNPSGELTGFNVSGGGPVGNFVTNITPTYSSAAGSNLFGASFSGSGSGFNGDSGFGAGSSGEPGVILVTGRRQNQWTTADFVAHYYDGTGTPVYLADVGLAGQFRGSSSVRSVKGRFIAQVMANAHPGYNYSSTGITDVTWTPNLFSVGHSTFFMSGSCGSSSCDFTFGIRDSFRDPFDIGVSGGGTPYRIFDGWKESVPYGG